MSVSSSTVLKWSLFRETSAVLKRQGYWNIQAKRCAWRPDTALLGFHANSAAGKVTVACRMHKDKDGYVLGGSVVLPEHRPFAF